MGAQVQGGEGRVVLNEEVEGRLREVVGGEDVKEGKERDVSDAEIRKDDRDEVVVSVEEEVVEAPTAPMEVLLG